MPADPSVPEEFWRGRRVLLTGHTGFKGAWLSLWLRGWRAEVTGYALAPSSTPNLWSIVEGGTTSIIGDIRDFAQLRAAVTQADPQIVIHMAAQALVKESYRDPLGTYATNVLGTGTLLLACRELESLQCVVVVTSDKVYENDGAGRPFEEGDRLGGHDPYSNSKACTELLTASFRESFFGAGAPIAIGSRRQRHRRRRLVRGPSDSRLRQGAGDGQAGDAALSGCRAAVAARARAARRATSHSRRRWCRRPTASPRAVNFGPDAASFCTVHEVVDAFSARFAGKPGWERDAAVHPRGGARPDPVVGACRAIARLAPASSASNEALAWTADWYRAHAAGREYAEVFRGADRAAIKRSAAAP